MQKKKSKGYGDRGRARCDFGTIERWTHGQGRLEPTENAGVFVARALVEHVLDALCLQGILTTELRDAGFHFKQDFQDAGLEERLVGSYSPVRYGASFGAWEERSDKEELAYKRWRAALCALTGRGAHVTVNVVCYDVCPTPFEQRPLVEGLQALYSFYQGAPSGRGRPFSKIEQGDLNAELSSL